MGSFTKAPSKKGGPGLLPVCVHTEKNITARRKRVNAQDCGKKKTLSEVEGRSFEMGHTPGDRLAAHYGSTAKKEIFIKRTREYSGGLILTLIQEVRDVAVIFLWKADYSSLLSLSGGKTEGPCLRLRLSIDRKQPHEVQKSSESFLRIVELPFI